MVAKWSTVKKWECAACSERHENDNPQMLYVVDKLFVVSVRRGRGFGTLRPPTYDRPAECVIGGKLCFIKAKEGGQNMETEVGSIKFQAPQW